MNKLNRNILEKKYFTIFSLLICTFILLGGFLYFKNYSIQNTLQEKVEFAEKRIQQLNEIHFGYIKSARENRSYRLYQKPYLKISYEKAKNKFNKLVNQFKLIAEHPKDSILFSEIKQLMLKRIDALDSTLNYPFLNSKANDYASPQIDPTNEEMIKMLENKYALIINYWKYESAIASKQFKQKNYSNDVLFSLWLVLTITITVMLIYSFQKRLKIQSINNQIFEEQNLKLEETNKYLEEFAYVASHDLKAPIRNIKGLLGIIKKKGDNLDKSKREEYIDVVLSAAEEMNILINNLLEYARTGVLQEKIEEIDLKETFISLEKQFELELQKLNGKILFNCADEKILVYPILFKRLLTNLISNSIKYRSDKPLIIKIDFNREKEKIIFSVRDNGIGIPKEYFDSIFQIFKMHKPNNESNGIGLSVCKKIVDLHNGKIWVESEQGNGASFYFTIATNFNF